MDDTKENIFLNKLNNSSKDIFLKCLNNLNKENDVKIAFYNFLFGDLITLDSNNYEFDLYDVVENPENILNNFISNIFEKIAENDSDVNYYNILKKKLYDEKSIIQNKVKECNSHIEILKNEYINMNLEKYIPINTPSKLLFENKTVLNLNLNFKKYRLLLGEFFTRFIFSLSSIKEDNNNIVLDSILNKNYFYSEDIINNYMTSDENIKEFKKINNNFKYWIILFYFTGQFFDKNSKYNTIFNDIEFNSYLNILVKNINPLQKRQSKKTNKGRKQQKQQKGSGNIKDFLVKTNKKELDKKFKKPNSKQITQQISEYNKIILYKNFYYIIAYETFIKKNTNLFELYYKQYNQNMINYFKSKIDDIQNTGEININNKIENPFNKKLINISNIIKVDKQKFLKEDIKKKIETNINFDIFQSLYLLLDPNNKKDIDIFIKRFKYNLILILFFLYNIKKKLYENYLLIIKEQFLIDNKENGKKENGKKENGKKENNKKENNKKENNKEENNKENDKKENKIKKIQNNILLEDNINLNNNLKEITKINIKIKLLENKLLTLDDSKGIKNYTEEILNIESQINRLHVKKYNAQK